MPYINAKTNTFGRNIYEVREAHPEASIPDGVDYGDFVWYAPTNPEYDPATQKAVEALPAQYGDNLLQAWDVVALTPDELDAVRRAPVPAAVTMRQARLALLGAGLLASVDAAIDSLTIPQKEAARIEWEYATEVQRSSGLVPMMVVALGLDDAALDALFIEAAAL